jgi:hypothetical protein
MITTWDLLGTRREGHFVNTSPLNMDFKACDAEILFIPVKFKENFCSLCFQVV